MAKNIQAIRGMNDYLPGETALWQRIEGSLKQVLGSYGYSEIRLPIVEQTPLFKRAIGEVTDVVEKEMYTFEDRNGDSLTLRPEGTAGCVRAGIEHGLLYNQEPPLIFLDKETPPILRTAFLLYIILLFHYHLYLFFYRYMPLPVADFLHILSILGNILLVLYQLIIHFLDQEGTTVA